MTHFHPDEFKNFYGLVKLGLFETVRIQYDDGTTIRYSYFKHYGVME